MLKISEVLNDSMVIMGIVNVTPDSFSDGGDYNNISGVVSRVKDMLEDGVQIIDMGGQSTRPGYKEVPPEEELNRLLPAIQAVREFSNVAISIDTYFPEVARACLQAGADIINDIHGGDNPAMLDVIQEFPESGYIYMHSRDRGDTPLLEELKAYHEELKGVFQDRGIALDRVCYDPGVGWKSEEDHIAIMADPEKYSPIGEVSTLYGLSRKRILQKITGRTDPKETDIASVVSSLKALDRGVNIVRVHNTRMMADAIKTYLAIQA